MICPSCTEPGTLACAGCKNVSYCSLVCQQTDWQFHKALCKKFRDFQVRPSPEMRRVIFFPDNAAKPEFKWLALEQSSRHPHEEAGIQELVKDTTPLAMTCSRNLITGAPADVAVYLCYDDNFANKYPDDNAAILAATNRKTRFCWRGPLVAYCVRDGDMDMNSYSIVVSLLIDYHNSEYLKLRRGPKVQGVRAYCQGERRVNKTGPSETVMSPRMHPIIDRSDLSGISKEVGMPLRLLKEAPKVYPPVGASGDFCNSPLTFIMLNCNPQDESFSWAPLHWCGGQVPNVLIVRQDLQPLDTDVVQAFGDFCEFYLKEVCEPFESQFGSIAERDAAVQKVMDELTPDVWNKYLAAWKPRVG